MQPESNEVTQKTKVTNQNRLTGAGDEFQPETILGGKYRVISVLGRGGMGIVYRVENIFLGNTLALKTIDKNHLSDVTIRRFQQEARAAFAIDHPNIIAVHDFGILDDQTPFLVMEMINGETLGERLKRSGALTVDEAIPIFVQVCFGLAYAHERGIVHRDIKPNNIMLLSSLPPGTEETVKVLDFGIAKFAQHEGGELQALTRTGEIFGSPLYMSPEQCAGERVDHRADIYSLGCVLFEALTGTPPCVGENALSTMMRHQSQAPPTLREASLGSDFPQSIEDIVATMLAKSPDTRYQNLGIVAHDLGTLSRGEAFSRTRGTCSLASEQVKAVTTIAMKRSHFYAILIGLVVVSVAIAGVSTYRLKSFQNERTVNDKPPAMQDPVTTSLEDNAKRFERRTEMDFGKEYVVFDFPENLSVGTFRGGDDLRQIKGEVRYIKTDSVSFRPSEAFLLTPDNLGQFAPNDLRTLDLRRLLTRENARSIMLQVAKLNGLQYLDISENEVGDEVLHEIEGLHNLQGLKVSRTGIDGTAMAKLANLGHITCIEFNRCDGAGDLLKGLLNYNSAKFLFLNSCRLTGTDFASLGALTRLHLLSLNKTSMTDADLSKLATLPKLTQLEARDCPISRASIPAILSLTRNGLKELTLSAQGFTQAEQLTIKRVLPNARFVSRGKKDQYSDALILAE